jgi:hypothetical protein
MRNAGLRSLLFLMLLSLVACQVFAPSPPVTKAPDRSTAGAPVSTEPLPAATHTATASLPPVPTPTVPATLTPEPTTTATSSLSANPGFTLRWHPDGPLYVGDQLSLEVIAPGGADLQGKTITIDLESSAEVKQLASAGFDRFGLGNRLQSTLWWFWDTTGLQAGPQTLRLTLQPDGVTWLEAVNLLPAGDLPDSEVAAQWMIAESQCCELHYLSGTAAERDLSQLLSLADRQASSVAEKLGIQIDEKIPILLLPRVLGHGGFSANEIAISYLDRNYAGRGSDMVLHHELVHWLDGRLGGDLHPSMLVEGLAVYLSGGHFKPEALLPRAAALLPPLDDCAPPVLEAGQASQRDLVAQETPTCSLGLYIPLAELVDNFYPSQHEIGYLQAGALVEYLVKTWGWPAFNDFYRDIHPQPTPTDAPGAGSPTTALEAALIKHFSYDLPGLEQAFIAAMRQEQLTASQVEDVRLSIAYFDSLRRYQQLLDSSAYFLYAWLADGEAMRQRDIVADYLRRPQAPENVTLELMFVNADTALRAGDQLQVDGLLKTINSVLDRWPVDAQAAFGADPLAADTFALVQLVQAAGYLPQRAELVNDEARVWVNTSGPDLLELHLQRNQQGWQIQQAVSSLLLESWADLLFGVMDRCIAS